MKTLIRTVLFFAAVALFAPRAVAQKVVYSNGAPDGGYTEFVSQGWAMMDDFVLSETTRMTGFRWYVLQTQGPDAIANARFRFELYPDSAGAPVRPVYPFAPLAGQYFIERSGTKVSAPDAFYPIYAFDATLGPYVDGFSANPGITLPAGRYWFAIGAYFDKAFAGNNFRDQPLSLGASSNSERGNALSWNSAAYNSDDPNYDFSLPNSGLDPTGTELAFEIVGTTTATPEPASLTLLLTGVAGIFVATRGRRVPTSRRMSNQTSR